MKSFLCSTLLCSALWGCNPDRSASQQEKEVTIENKDHLYGANFEQKNVVSVAQLQEALQEQDSVRAVVAGTIESSCQSKGCWMDVKMANNSTMKVTFKDYGFFLPVEDLSGKEVVFTGTAKREVISVDDQRHYAKDAGKTEKEINAITAPKEELRFVADGVILQ